MFSLFVIVRMIGKYMSTKTNDVLLVVVVECDNCQLPMEKNDNGGGNSLIWSH